MPVKRSEYVKRFEALKTERSSWDEHWRDLSNHILPRRSRFFSSDKNSGKKKNQYIINDTATRAARVLSSGMMAGVTSPARPWFRLTTPDPELAEHGPVRAWLHFVEERIREAFLKSNIYNGFHTVYEDIGTFGTAAMLVEDDTEDALRAYVFPVGSYCLANSERLRVDTIYRETGMPVRSVVRKFGLAKCSTRVQQLFREGQLDTWIDVCHVIEPRADTDRNEGRGALDMPWGSYWMEVAGDDTTGFLRESGYQEFPVLAPRWAATGEDTYGAGPGMQVLGDARALQLLEKRKAQAVDKIVSPPMRAPTSLANRKVSLMPGETTYVDAIGTGQVFAPAFEVQPVAITVLEASIREHERRINSGYFADLWLMLSEADSTQKTAREVAERHEEKMLQLGPVMERITDELLDPVIERAFSMLLRNGKLPPPPEELQGMDTRVEYISIMAQAQKLLGTSSIERLAGFVGNLAAANPAVLDKVNFDQMVDEYGGSLGIKPDLIRSDEEVAQIRAERAKQQAAAAQMEQAAQAVQGAKVLSETDMQGDSALNRLVSNIGGVAASAAKVQ